MKTFIIEYETLPMRAIYTVEGEFENEEHARSKFFDQMPTDPDHRIRKIYEKDVTMAQCTSSNGYLSDIHGNTGHNGDKHRCETGDKGQRYEVRADFSGVDKCIGWTNTPNGGSLMEGAKKWPACTKPYIVDRHAKTNV